MPEIEFHNSTVGMGEIPRPYPASRHTPEWFKTMPAELNDFPTLKRCGPFVEAMTAGYIIPAPGNARFTKNDDDLIRVECDTHNYVGLHHPDEYAGSSFEGKTILKFANPWIIVTDPDVVCFISAPINHFDLPLLPIAGIVETGYFYRQVALPVISLLERGIVYELRRGAPMMQVIPFRRDEWTSRVGDADGILLRNQRERLEANPHYYKDELWQKLRFS
jgi:hypothetical protein